jgi:hypothetical protein
MKTTTKVIFASALMLAAAAPTLSHAAYFVDQTKTWAVENALAQDHMGKVTRHDTAKTQASKGQAFGVGNTSVPGIGIDKDDSRTQKSK